MYSDIHFDSRLSWRCFKKPSFLISTTEVWTSIQIHILDYCGRYWTHDYAVMQYIDTYCFTNWIITKFKMIVHRNIIWSFCFFSGNQHKSSAILAAKERRKRMDTRGEKEMKRLPAPGVLPYRLAAGWRQPQNCQRLRLRTPSERSACCLSRSRKGRKSYEEKQR